MDNLQIISENYVDIDSYTTNSLVFKLIDNFDASVWAHEFMKIFPFANSIVDESTMLGWFANAMMTGYDAGYKQAQENRDDAYDRGWSDALTV